MKFLLISAFALAIAAPAAGQTMSHQAHAQQHGAHGAGHAAHANHAQHHVQGQPVEHGKHANCCGDASGSGRIDCCEGAQAGQRSCCEKHAAGGKAQPAQPK